MDYQTAKLALMTGLVDGEPATADQLREARAIVAGQYDQDRAAQADKIPPAQPPVGPPPEFPNSKAGANNLDPGVFISDEYVMQLQYDVYVYNCNQANAQAFRNYSDRYESWRLQFVEQGQIAPVPHAPVYQKPYSLTQFAAWWEANKQSATNPNGGAHPPHDIMPAPQTSDFDFGQAIADKKARKH